MKKPDKFTTFKRRLIQKPIVFASYEIGLTVYSRVKSKLLEKQNTSTFDNVSAYVMFIGYPRSGHSLIGHLIDAHPNAIISEELDALKFFQKGFTRAQIHNLILQNSKNFIELEQQKLKYKYLVPGQWQGKFQKLTHIGDRKGGDASKRFLKDPTLLERMKAHMGGKFKLIHVYRNPYDIIATRAKNIFVKDNISSDELDKTIDIHFVDVESVARVQDIYGESIDIYNHKHEEFVKSPKENLKKLMHFLDLEATEEYLDNCVSILFESPKVRRKEVEWTKEQISRVAELSSKYDYLREYSWDE